MAQMEHRVALITGAARGQGRSHALRLAGEGADIIAIDICSQMPLIAYPLGTADDLAETVREVEKLGRRCVSFTADARDAARMREVVAQAVEELGRLDTVVVNHGISIPTSVEDDAANDAWNTVIDTNLSAVWRTITATVPHLREHGGSILVTASAAGLIGMYGNPAYVAAKHGIIGLVKALAADLARYWIRVNAICPGNVPTTLLLNGDTLAAFFPGNPSAQYSDLEFPLSAMNLLATPWVETKAVSDAVLYLAAESGKYVTGIALPVDAGFTTQMPGINPLLGKRLAELAQAAGATTPTN